jgi:DNA-binding transcriptional LysR family regulator
VTDQKRASPFNWEDVRYFLALSRLGNLTATARELRVSHATTARRIGALEKSLGCVLFDRRPDGYELTAQGREMLKLGASMELSATAIEQIMQHFRSHGVVRVSMVRSFADRFLVERLSRFRKENPDISLEIITDTRIVSLARREADIALRLGRPKDSSLIGRKVAQVRYAFYASASQKLLAKDSDLPIVTYDDGSSETAEAEFLGARLGNRRISFRSNSNEAQAAAARAGFGAVMLPRYLGDTDTGLREVTIIPPLPPRDLWILSPRELSKVPRLRAVVNGISEAIAAGKSLL